MTIRPTEGSPLEKQSTASNSVGPKIVNSNFAHSTLFQSQGERATAERKQKSSIKEDQQPAASELKDAKKDAKKAEDSSDDTGFFEKVGNCICCLPRAIVSCIKAVFNKIIYILTCCQNPVDRAIKDPIGELKALGKNPSDVLSNLVYEITHRPSGMAESFANFAVKIPTYLSKAAEQFEALPFTDSKFEAQYKAAKNIQALEKALEEKEELADAADMVAPAPKKGEKEEVTKERKAANEAKTALEKANADYDKKYDATKQDAMKRHGEEGRAELQKAMGFMGFIKCLDTDGKDKEETKAIEAIEAKLNKDESFKKLKPEDQDKKMLEALLDDKACRKAIVARMKEMAKAFAPAQDDKKADKFPKIAAILQPIQDMVKDESTAINFIKAYHTLVTEQVPMIMKAFKALDRMPRGEALFGDGDAIKRQMGALLSGVSSPARGVRMHAQQEMRSRGFASEMDSEAPLMSGRGPSLVGGEFEDSSQAPSAHRRDRRAPVTSGSGPSSHAPRPSQAPSQGLASASAESELDDDSHVDNRRTSSVMGSQAAPSAVRMDNRGPVMGGGRGLSSSSHAPQPHRGLAPASAQGALLGDDDNEEVGQAH